MLNRENLGLFGPRRRLVGSNEKTFKSVLGALCYLVSAVSCRVLVNQDSLETQWVQDRFKTFFFCFGSK